MKVSEGNWIQFGWKCPTDDGDIYFTDDIVTIESLIHIKNQPHNYKPIPLTEDWLLKFGFNKFPGIEKIYDTDDFWHIEYVDESKTHGYWCSHLEIYIKYVHSLQNLYFALTQKELKLN